MFTTGTTDTIAFALPVVQDAKYLKKKETHLKTLANADAAVSLYKAIKVFYATTDSDLDWQKYIQQNYPDLLSFTENNSPLLTHEVPLPDDFEPFKQNMRPISPAQLKCEKEFIEANLAAGCIERVMDYSTCSSNLLFVPRPDHSYKGLYRFAPF